MKAPTNRVLMVFAHADDETLLAGGLIVKLTSMGYEVTVLCLAPGDADRIRRLRAACEVLGVVTVETLRYTGSAMWPDELDHPTSTSESVRGAERISGPVLALAPIADLAARIGGRIGEINPDIVVTHSQYGDYGHVDHAMANKATVRAFEVSADARAVLYALAWPKRLVRFNARLMKIGGRDIKRMGPDGRFNLLASIQSMDSAGPVHSLNVGSGLGTRRRASRAYSEEIAMGPLVLRLLERAPLWFQRLILGKARLTVLKSPVGISPDEVPCPNHFEKNAPIPN
ncbi:MAG: PIG-L family deacetylase [Chloroflexi bacterium]|nr:PIG-L family deacetylase [Chloroflexota bacterium]